MEGKTERLAYLLGAIYGDGSFSKDKKIFFGVTDKDFIDEVVAIVYKLFKVRLTTRIQKLSLKNPNWKDYFNFSSRELYRHLNKYNPRLGKELPKFIKNGSLQVKASFIKGFFDAEGNVNVHPIKRKDGRTDIIRHVKCYSNNIKLLKEIKQFLSELEIKSEIFRGKKENYYVCIWNYKGLTIFNEFIGFVIKRKQSKLEQALNSYKEIQNQWDVKTYKTVMKLRKTQKIGAKKIKQKLSSNDLNIPQSTIEAWIYGRYKVTETKMEV